MIKKLYQTSACLLAATIFLSGCSMLTTQGRQQRAYSRYVHKMSGGRAKQQKLFAKGKSMPVTQPTESIMTSESSGPQSVGDGSGQ
ncbi:MAG: hypothetical protein ABIR29_14625 [Chthoniobacterales bacterium]